LQTCPKCFAAVTYRRTTSQFLSAWFLGDLWGTFITILIIAAFACMGADMSDVGIALGGVAATIVSFKLWRRSADEQRNRGVFRCSTCGYRHQPDGAASAI
jgi:hypothetical protein